jgi:cytochrome b
MDTTTKTNYSPISLASHWILTASFVVAYATTYSKWFFWLHFLAGFVFAAVLVFKLVRLLISNDDASIRAYTLSPTVFVSFVKKLLTGVKDHFTTHNPLSSYNSLAIYGSSIVLVTSGILFFLAKEISLQPRSVTHNLKEVHELFANLALLFVVIHILGVIADKYIFKGELYKLMVQTKGYEAAKEGVWAFALIFLLGYAFISYGKISAKQPEPSGEVYALYKKECASCHFAYPANLYTKASWEGMMETLEDHYGEDATITEEKQKIITDYLLVNSISTGKSKPAVFFSDVNISQIGSIIKSEPYKKKHKGLDDNKTKLANCVLCHTDAISGQFALVNIQKPRKKDKNGLK